VSAGLPALSCIDDLAGETVLTACEKVLFGSAESTAAALSYAGPDYMLTGFGDVPQQIASMTPELQMVGRAVERDRYGLMAYVLAGARPLYTLGAASVSRSYRSQPDRG